MGVKVRRLDVKGFRGIPYPTEINIGERGLVVFGENGTGKSSIVEAFEFFFKGSVEKIDEVQALKLKEHATHVDCNITDTAVALLVTPGDDPMMRTYSSAPRVKGFFKPYFEEAVKGDFILRRSDVLNFILSSPHERFEAIGELIGIGDLDRVELEFKKAQDALVGESESIEDGIKTTKLDLAQLLGDEYIDTNQALGVINKHFDELSLPGAASWENIPGHLDTLFTAVQETAVDPDALKWERIKQYTAKPAFDAKVGEVIDELSGIEEELKSEDVSLDLRLISLLETGQSILTSNKLDECPLCEQSINREELIEKIRDRLNILRALSEKASAARTGCSYLINVFSGFSRIWGEIAEISWDLKGFEEQAGKFDGITVKLKEVISALNVTQNDVSRLRVGAIKDLLSEVTDVVSSAKGICSKRIQKATERKEGPKTIAGLWALVDNVFKTCENLKGLETKSILTNKAAIIAEEIYKLFNESKTSVVKGVYKSLESDINKYYSEIHPGEEHKLVELDISKRASTDVRIESFGRKGEDPRAFTSEGHLDTLGVCIFLSFVKSFNKRCRLLILDDVISTVDSRHRLRVIPILLKEFGEYQMIITTCDGLWYEELLSAQEADNIRSDFINLQIVNWTRERGPVIRPYKTRWENIDAFLTDGQKEAAGSAGREYLEDLLEKICVDFRVKVIFKAYNDRRYTVFDLYDDAKIRLLNKLIKDDNLKAALTARFTELEKTKLFGNLLSHNNPDAKNLSIDEVKAYCEAVRQIELLLKCKDCGNRLRYYQDAAIIKCSNKKCKYQTIFTV